MPIADAVRWNARYNASPPTEPGVSTPRDWLVAQQHWLPAGGLALDAAMGQGGSACWLAARGFQVVGIDISEVAARQAKAQCPALMAVVADLVGLVLPENTFDVILNFYYLDRALWPQYRRALRPGGVLFFETFMRPPDGSPPAISPAHTLEPGELRAAFADWRLLADHEGAPLNCATPEHPNAPSRVVASVVARREH
jgi:SAM-dependent methyltransferase